MSDLMCSAVNCIYNITGLCSAKNIHILTSRDSTCCEKFLNKNFKNTITSFMNTNLLGEVKQVIDQDEIILSPNITCEAVKCVYNSENKCYARHVQIYGLKCKEGQCTRCEVFMKK